VATVNGYLINVKDRIVLTGYFDASALNMNVDDAQFFVNGVNTDTLGIDLVFAWKRNGIQIIKLFTFKVLV
jgi:iron complex outermembrane receptor protein